jgi:hypothetical protein
LEEFQFLLVEEKEASAKPIFFYDMHTSFLSNKKYLPSHPDRA